MSRSVNIFVYLGSNEEGFKLEAQIQQEAKKRGFIKKNGEPNVSMFIVHCVKSLIEREKKK